jgi:predicted nucleotidyltransferase
VLLLAHALVVGLLLSAVRPSDAGTIGVGPGPDVTPSPPICSLHSIGMATARNEHLRRLAQRVADALPAEIAEEIVLTGSVSRGMADEVSDIEMLVVTREPLELEDCFRLTRAASLDQLDTWGAQGGPTRRVSGSRERVPVELIWWPRDYAEEQIDALLAGEMPSTADALAHGISLRTSGRFAAWRERLCVYPPDLASAKIEQAALPWGGFAPAGLLTLIRPGDQLALTEWILDGAIRILTIVFALNRVWQPTTKRVAVRVAPLQIKPDRLAGRIEEALTEPDPRRALRVMTELQLDSVLLAPSGPNVDRARTWLAQGVDILHSTDSRA